ncbi:hypothetical protein AB0D08_25835 [Kitasatospora sp. NPDC048540]|uniref:hypothetical protein n=1 Tax=unclassified Kitasatospora TaxID=2633591 RepID=UPI00053B6410|nr:hypothetical protein [Kitasatospora sp. MBT63]
MNDITFPSGPATGALDPAVARAHRPCPDPGPHPALDGSPIALVSEALWAALAAMAEGLDRAAAAADPAGTACDVLRLIVAAAEDTAEPGERPGLLYVTPSVAELGSRPVWLLRSGPHGTVLAGFPSDM